MSLKKFLIDLFSKNKLYKIVALVISVLLWVNILGKVGWGLVHEFPLQILLGSNLVITNEVPKHITLRLSGPESSVKKYIKSGAIISIDANDESLGWKTIFLKKEDINTPVGVKILSITPKKLFLHIEKSQESKE